MSDSKQITVSLRPIQYSSAYSWNVSYVRLDVNQYGNGFSLNTDGDPFDKSLGAVVERLSQPDHVGARHTPLANTVTVQPQRAVSSPGGAYTPIVVGDINGDGYGNDRAFIFDPTHTVDAGIASAMQTLLAGGSPANARSCLDKQLGQIAGRNTCEGLVVASWRAHGQRSTRSSCICRSGPTISRSRSTTFRKGLTCCCTATIICKGAGQPAIVDSHAADGHRLQRQHGRVHLSGESPVWLGDQYVSASPVRAHAPGWRRRRNCLRERQSLTQMLDRGRATPGAQGNGVAASRWQYSGGGGVTNPMAMLLRQSDSLNLTTDQADSIAAYNRYFTTRLDSTWTPIAEQLATLPDKYDQSEAYRIYRYGREQSFDLLIAIGPRIDGLLTGRLSGGDAAAEPWRRCSDPKYPLPGTIQRSAAGTVRSARSAG